MRRYKNLSITSQGTRVQFVIGVTLTSIIPLLVSSFLLSPMGTELGLGTRALVILLVCTFGLTMLGFVILLRYPINVVRLRCFLEDLASGNLPDPKTVAFIKDEDDMYAIEHYMINIIKQTDERIHATKQQAAELVQAEAQRAMIASLGAACHHLGQPATVLIGYLNMIARQDLPPEVKVMIANCKQSAEQIGDILDRLRSVATFRIEPYRPVENGQGHRSDEHILKVR